MRFFGGLLAWSALLCHPLHARGVVAWKEQPHHADASAKARWFERMEGSGRITWFFFADSRMGFEEHQPFRYINVDLRPAEDLLKQSGLEELDAQIAKLSAFARQFPAAGPLLKARVDELDRVRRQYSGGVILHEGKWLPLAEYEQLKARQEAAKLLVRESAQQSRRIEARKIQQRDTVLRKRWILGIAAGGLLLLLIGLLARLRRLAWASLLVLLAGAGWLTWQSGGYAWLRELRETAAELFRDPPWR